MRAFENRHKCATSEDTVTKKVAALPYLLLATIRTEYGDVMDR